MPAISPSEIFGMITGVGKSFEGAYDRSQQRGVANEELELKRKRRAAYSGLDPNDLGAIASTAMTLGDLETAMTATRLAEARSDRDFTRQYQSRSLNLQERNAEEAAELRRLANDPEHVAKLARAKEGGRGKPLGDKSISTLNEVGSTLASFDRYTSTFNDKYAGKSPSVGGVTLPIGGKLVGDVENAIGNAVPGSELAAQADWWKDYQGFRNTFRHSQFGASLTATEKAEFEKADIDAGMDPAQIRKNLKRQQEIALVAARRVAGPHLVQGADAAAVDEALGAGTLSRLGMSAPRKAAEGTSTPDAPPVAPAPKYEEGRRYRSKSTGKVYVIRNGQPVEDTP